MTTFRISSPEALGTDERRVWLALQRADPALEPPFFHPEFTRAVAQVRPGVEVAVLEDGGEPVGFLPYERRGRTTAVPVGGRLADFQGAIIRPGVAWEPAAVLRACGLRAFEFDHLLASQAPFRPYHRVVVPSAFADVSHGFAAWAEGRRQAGSGTIFRLGRKLRKLERLAGPVRLDFHSTDPADLATLLRWKAEQYHRTTTTDVTAFPWVRTLLERFLATDVDGFAGVLSTLRAGDRLVAAMVSLRAGGVLHAMIPSYDRTFHPTSPGLLLLLGVLEAAPALGIRHLHFGKGPEDYKRHFASHAVPVAEGWVETRPLVGALRRGTDGARRWVLSSPLRRPAREMARAAAWVVPTLRDRLKMR